jgi:hypothetical protein
VRQGVPSTSSTKCFEAFAAGLCIAIAVLSAPARSSACSCPSSAAAAVWPEDGAAGVPLDTPLVVWRYNQEGPTDLLRYSLTREDGDEVPLTITEILPPAFDGCGVGAMETLFLRAARSLDPGATYVLHSGGGAGSDASFTTGNAAFTAEADVEADLQYLLARPADCSGPDCVSLAEARIDLGARPEAPRWLVIESAATRHNRNAFTFWPEETQIGSSWQLSVALPPDDDCIDVRVYGLEGTPLFEQRRCEPDRCMLYEIQRGSDCGGPPFAGVDAAGVPHGSCDDPPDLGSTPGDDVVSPDDRTPREPEADAGADVGDMPHSSCSMGRTQRSASHAWLIAVAAAVLCRRRRTPMKKRASRSHDT